MSTVIRRLRALRRAIDRACIARGEAQWTNGYSAGAEKADDMTLFAKKRAQWADCGKTEKAVTRAIYAYTRAIKSVSK